MTTINFRRRNSSAVLFATSTAAILSLFPFKATAADTAAFFKGPYSLINIDLDGGSFTHRSSKASSGTVVCNGIIYAQQFNTNTGCSEQFNNTGFGGFSMGVRPIRYLQADAVGIDFMGSFNGYGNRTSTFTCVSGCTGSTTFKIGTTNGLVTTGGRLVLPLFHGKMTLSAGGGYSWLRAFEHADTTGAEASCSSCRSVTGRGPYEMGEIMYFPNPHLGIGLRVRNAQIQSTGLTPDGVFSHLYLGTTYRDQFLQIGGVISIRGGGMRN